MIKNIFILITLTISAGFSLPSVTNGLVAAFLFNGNTQDSSAVPHNKGTPKGIVLTADRFGIADKAYKFNGKSYLSVYDDFIQLNCNNY